MNLFGVSATLFCAVLSLMGTGEPVEQSTELTVEQLYAQSIVDAETAEQAEILPLVTLTVDDAMTTWNDEGKVLLLTWNSYPDSYQIGKSVTLSYGSIWTFTDQEMLAWYGENMGTFDDAQLRLNQLIGLPADDDKTHFTALWVDPADVMRPAYITDVTESQMQLEFAPDTAQEYITWFEDNAEYSYYSDNPYPWTRLGYTYDWADNGEDYGLTEFLVVQDAVAQVEFTMSTDEFLTYMESQLSN